MRDLFPKDRLRQFLMALFLVLAVIELSRRSFIWGTVDIIFQLVFHPKYEFWFKISGTELLNDEDNTNARQIDEKRL